MSLRIATRDPAPPVPLDGGGSGRWAWLLTAGGIVEAELVRGVLESSGVPVVLDRRDPSPFAWMYLGGNVNAPVKVFVPATLLSAARLQLLEAGMSVEGGPDPAPVDRAERSPQRLSRTPIVRLALTLVAVLVALWILLSAYLAGSATCSIRIVC